MLEKRNWPGERHAKIKFVDETNDWTLHLTLLLPSAQDTADSWPGTDAWNDFQ